MRFIPTPQEITIPRADEVHFIPTPQEATTPPAEEKRFIPTWQVIMEWLLVCTLNTMQTTQQWLGKIQTLP